MAAISLEVGLLTYLSLPHTSGDCYAQALGVVVIGSLSVKLSGKVKVRSDCPSCHATQGQNHSVRCGCRGSGEVRQSA